jgi:hypothetical protein
LQPFALVVVVGYLLLRSNVLLVGLARRSFSSLSLFCYFTNFSAQPLKAQKRRTQVFACNQISSIGFCDGQLGAKRT